MSKDKLGVDIEIGDVVIVGSNYRVRIGKVYAFGSHGQPLCEPLLAERGCRKGDLGTSYIIIKRGEQKLAELEAILNG